MHADQLEVQRILPLKQLVEGRLLAIPGVTGVDIGLKETGGEKTPVHAIIIFVKHKGDYRPDDEIPRVIAGVPTDVIEATFELQRPHPGTAPATGEITVDNKRYNPCQGGACILPARFPNGYGSLGMLVKDASTKNPLWLSVYHVLCDSANWTTADKRVVQPSIGQGGNVARDVIGDVTRGVYGQVVVDWGYDLYVDAAVCTVSGRAASSNLIVGGTPKGAHNAVIADLVSKYGATTMYTHGVIVSTNFTVKLGSTTFYYQYRAEGAFPGQPLSQAGDSGSAVLDSGGYVIGLIMSGDGVKYSTINPIGQIIDALSIEI